MPKKDLAIKIVKALLDGKDVPIGKFYVAQFNTKLQFDKFHG